MSLNNGLPLLDKASFLYMILDVFRVSNIYVILFIIYLRLYTCAVFLVHAATYHTNFDSFHTLEKQDLMKATVSHLDSAKLYLLPVIIILWDTSRSVSTEPTNITPSITDSSNQEPTIQTTETYEFGDRLGEDLRSVAYYLRQYKFNEYDQRYITDLEEAVSSRIYFKGFPKPPLRSLHWEVRKYCEPSFLGCIAYLIKRIRNTALKRNDDTNVIIEDQKWFYGNFSEQIEQTDLECQKMWRVGEERADPFEGPIERFQWRVTASYFLCWYAMKGTTELRRLNETSCDNHANCLQTYFGPHNGDIRADDSVPFNCARYSFCPDPCCPIHHMRSYSECWSSPVNPCFEENTPGNQQCSFNMSSNTEFQDIILNRWNVSCKCPKSGYRWSSLYGICVDIDECAENMHNCIIIKEACINLPGSFKCVCRWGYIWNKETKTCEQSSALDTLVLRKNSELENEEMNTTESFFKRLLNKFSNRSNCLVSHGTLIQFLFTIIFLL